MHLSYRDVVPFLRKKEADGLKIPFIKQAGENTCWAACYEMVEAWRNRRRNGCEYINLQTGDCKNCLRPQGKCDKERPVAKILNDWWELGYKSTLHYECNLNENEIRRAIRDVSPVQAFIKFRGKSVGHYVLIVGIERHEFNADVLLGVLDPANGYTTKSVGELFQWGTWLDTWVVK